MLYYSIVELSIFQLSSHLLLKGDVIYLFFETSTLFNSLHFGIYCSLFLISAPQRHLVFLFVPFFGEVGLLLFCFCFAACVFFNWTCFGCKKINENLFEMNQQQLRWKTARNESTTAKMINYLLFDLLNSFLVFSGLLLLG